MCMGCPLLKETKVRVDWRTSRKSIYSITDTESYRDLQQSYGAYNFLTELEIRTVLVFSRPYNQGKYCCCAGMARWPLTMWLVQCSNNSVSIWTALFFTVGPLPGPALANDLIGWHWRQQQEFYFCVLLISFQPLVLSTMGGIRANSWDAQSSYAHQIAAQCWGQSLQSGCRNFGISVPNCFHT